MIVRSRSVLDLPGYKMDNSASSISTVRPPFKKINDSLYELYAPPAGERPTVEIIFFHEFYSGPLEDIFWKTWTCQNNCWPETILKRELPRARVLFASYDASVTQLDTCGRLDLYQIGENLVQDLQQVVCSSVESDGASYPLFLVAHSFGGLVAKQVILHADNKVRRGDAYPRLKTFLDNLGGIFYFSNAHSGPNITIFSSLFSQDSPFRLALSVLDSECARLHNEIKKWRELYPIKAHALVEKNKTCVGTRSDLVVTETSARAADVDSFYTSLGVHFTVCAPPSQESSGIQELLHYIKGVVWEHLYRQKTPLLRWRELVKSGKVEEVVEDMQAMGHIIHFHVHNHPVFETRMLKLRACVLSKLGRYDEVLADLNKLHELNPKDLVTILRVRSLVRATMEDSEGARKDLEGALAAVDAKRVEAEIKENKLAFTQKHKEIKENKHDLVLCLRDQGLLKRMMGDLSGALADLDKGWELRRMSGISDYGYQLLKERGYVKFLMEDLESAQADAEQAFRMKPSHTDARKFRHAEGPYIAFPQEYGEVWFGAFHVEYLGFKLV